MSRYVSPEWISMEAEELKTLCDLSHMSGIPAFFGTDIKLENFSIVVART
jgi:hypothetical protein